MKKKLNFDRTLMQMELPGEVLPGEPLIEIIGNRRVLIENQIGVCSYGRCSITIKVSHGLVRIEGTELELCQMSADRLVVTGVIMSVSLTDWR